MTSLKVLSQYVRKVHSTDIQNGRARSFPGSTSTSRSNWLQDHILDRLSLQTWTVSSIGRSWTVYVNGRQPQDTDAPDTIYHAPEAIQIFTRELCAREQQYLSRQAVGGEVGSDLLQLTGRLTSAADTALLTNWIRRTGWEEQRGLKCGWLSPLRSQYIDLIFSISTVFPRRHKTLWEPIRNQIS